VTARAPSLPFSEPGPRRTAALAATFAALTLLFVVLGFPYERLAPRLEALLEMALGADAQVGRIEPGISRFLPQARAWDVDLRWPGGAQIHLDRVRVRPAWSLSWLRGRPAFRIALRRGKADVDGTVRLGDRRGFAGRVSALPLDDLPLATWAPGLLLTGRLDAEIDVHAGEQGAEGTATLSARDGSLSLPTLPIGVPFEGLQADLALGGESLATLHAFALDGPLVAITASGTIGAAPVVAAAPLALAARIEARDPSVREMLSGTGTRFDALGVSEVSIVGTIAAPVVRPAGVRPPEPRSGPPTRPSPPGPSRRRVR